MKTRYDRSEHYIFIKRYNQDGEVFYSKFECFNSDFYSRIMKREFTSITKSEAEKNKDTMIREARNDNY